MVTSAAAAFEDAKPFFSPFNTSVLDAGLRTAPSFPLSLFSPKLAQIARDFADGCSAPIDYIGASILAVAGAAIGDARRGQAFDHGGWAVPPIMWVGLVGDPSSMKSPSMRVVIRPLHLIEEELAASFGPTMRRYNTEKAAADEEHDKWTKMVKMAVKDGAGIPEQPAAAVAPEKPTRPRCVIKDATPEAVQVIVANSPKLLSANDELASFFDFERYNSGGRSFWLTAFEGDTLSVDRKGAEGSILIKFNGVSVLGSTQPDKLAEIFKGADDGLASRLLLIWPDKKAEYAPPTVTADEAAWLDYVRALHGLRSVLKPDGTTDAARLKLEPAALARYVQWRNANNRSENDGGPLFKGYVGKLPGFVMRLALILELLDWAETGGPEPQTICETVMLRTIEFVEQYGKPMAMRVFRDAERPKVEHDAATLARHILKTRSKAINLSKLRSLALPGLRDAEALSETAEFLVEAGWLSFAGQRAGGTSGRMSKDYAVNPSVHRPLQVVPV